ncbi:MAG: isoprenyl transferase [Bacteroidales bacterium]|nr:isoprenyl transferase [Bacteroidales bacterium]
MFNMLEIDRSNVPAHIAIIMDGNGRWAKNQGQERVFGQRHGVEAVRSVIEGAGEIGVKYLTLYAFSTENWNRPKAEVDALMNLLVQAINNELDGLMKNQVRVRVIGDMESLPEECMTGLQHAIEMTSGNKGLCLVLAISYSSKWECVEMVKKISKLVKDNALDIDKITAGTISDNMSTAGIPDPDILIRTGGECRVSNFLLWQLAYTELFFSPIMWPDFRKQDLWEIIANFQNRERRFGKIGEQVNGKP